LNIRADSGADVGRPEPPIGWQPPPFTLNTLMFNVKSAYNFRLFQRLGNEESVGLKL